MTNQIPMSNVGMTKREGKRFFWGFLGHGFSCWVWGFEGVPFFWGFETPGPPRLRRGAWSKTGPARGAGPDTSLSHVIWRCDGGGGAGARRGRGGERGGFGRTVGTRA